MRNRFQPATITGGSCHKYYFCCDKYFSGHNIILSRQKTCLWRQIFVCILPRQTRVCHKTFVVTKITLVAAPESVLLLSGIVSLRRRCLAMIDAQGGYTRYSVCPLNMPDPIRIRSGSAGKHWPEAGWMFLAHRLASGPDPFDQNLAQSARTKSDPG